MNKLMLEYIENGDDAYVAIILPCAKKNWD